MRLVLRVRIESAGARNPFYSGSSFQNVDAGDH